MKTIEINKRQILSTNEGYQFIPIGDPDPSLVGGGRIRQLFDKLFKQHSARVEDFWATLGRQDGQAIDWTGEIICSRKGNNASTGITAEEIDLLKVLHPDIKNSGERALEKVLVFDNVKFGNDAASKLMRLTVMADPDDGILVYYQQTTSDDERSEKGFIEYIHPQQNKNYANNQRDRLDYFFTVPNDVSDVNRFIVKVIVFKRDKTLPPEQLLKNIEKPYHLLRFNATTNSFDDITSSGVSEDERKLKTLLLIHGTFSSTQGSFGALYINSDWMKSMTTPFGGNYEQILALDHPTIFEGPDANVEKMKALMGAGIKFTQLVDIITTSRGGLVGKTIVNDVTIDRNLFTVERVAAQACANGVEYFTAGWKIAKGLSMLKIFFKIEGRPGLEIFSAIAQTGTDFFLQQPGPVAMTIGSAPLTNILDGKPANSNMRYYPVTGNYKPGTTQQRMVNLLVEAVYKGQSNDWVVGTTQQALMPTANYAYGQTKGHDYNYYFNNTFNSIHTQYFIMPEPTPGDISVPKNAIKFFLKDTNVM